MKGYTVFNAEQADGLPAHFYVAATPIADPAQKIDHAEAFFAATGADIRHGGNSAYYAIGSDHVQMPPFETFQDAEGYYATLALAHETTHWTRHT
jgi:antirestriction protein ArdC